MPARGEAIRKATESNLQQDVTRYWLVTKKEREVLRR
jgi:hypothetical protein